MIKFSGLNEIELDFDGTIPCENCGKNIEDESSITLSEHNMRELIEEKRIGYELYRECQHCEEFNKWVSITPETFDKNSYTIIENVVKYIKEQ